MNKLMIRGAALFFLLMVSQGTNAIGWVGASGICVSGGKNTTHYGLYCDWAPNTGAYYGNGQTVSFLMAQGGNTGDNKAYVPKSGYYTTKVYWCAYPENMDTCSKAKGSVLLVGDRVWMEQSKSFSQQRIFNHDQTKKAPSTGGYCFTITDDNGYEYRGDMGYGPDNRGKFCGDAHRLPVEPPKCSFNNGTDLDVQLGKLERTDIAVKSGTTTPVTKDISIKCDGNIVYNANMKLEFTPISVSNEQVISTSTTGLGVAVLYNGKAVQPGQTFPLSYQPGIHTLTLGFEAVRDPAMAAADLKTGDFTASAVLVFTEQ